MSQHEPAPDIGGRTGAESAGQGLPVGLPDPVPDVAAGIHSSISAFLAGGFDGPGTTVSDVAANAMGARFLSTATGTASAIPL